MIQIVINCGAFFVIFPFNICWLSSQVFLLIFIVYIMVCVIYIVLGVAFIAWMTRSKGEEHGDPHIEANKHKIILWQWNKQIWENSIHNITYETTIWHMNIAERLNRIWVLMRAWHIVIYTICATKRSMLIQEYSFVCYDICYTDSPRIIYFLLIWSMCIVLNIHFHPCKMDTLL
jgi:hypothetical protein